MANPANLIQTMLYDNNNTPQMIVDALITNYDNERVDTLKRIVTNYQKGQASNPSQTPIIKEVETLLNAL